MKTKKKCLPAGWQGFTLVELLVTISILSILAVVSAVVFTGVTANVRDGQRKKDLQIIKQALELYRSDQGFYPYRINSSSDPTCNFGNDTGSLYYVITGSLALTNQIGIATPPSLLKTYLSTIPTDPKDSCGAGNDRVYIYVPFSQADTPCYNSTDYCVKYCLYAQMDKASNNYDSSLCSTPTYATSYLYEVPSP